MGNSKLSNHSKRQDMAAALLEDVLKYLKLNKEITKDNFAFRIVTVGSFGIFMLCSILSGLTTYFGEKAIVCHVPGKEEFQEIMEQYCYMHGSYDLTRRENENCFEAGDKAISSNGDDDNETDIRTMYYQWVVFALVMSAILFRLPARVCRKLQGKWTTKTYYLKFLVCQCLALLVLYLNFYGTDQFLDKKFITYGIKVVEYHRNNTGKLNPMCNTFPTRVSCQFDPTGTGGSTESKNGYCLLTQNIINEKIYLALWFWFVAMFAIMISQLIWEVCFLTLPLVDLILELILPSSSGICSKYLRQFLIGQLTGTRFLTRNMIDYLQNRSFGDVFILYQLGKNTHPNFFYEMLEELAVNERKQEAEKERMLPNDGLEMNPV